MVSTQNKPASTPAPGRITTATVLTSHYKDGATVPNFVEVEGRIYTGDRDQAELRDILERSRLHDIITRAGKEVTQAYNGLWALDHDAHGKQCLAALRAVGHFLVNQREYGLLKTLYLTLRERDETTDTIMNAIRRGAYQANDEYLFFLGEEWQGYLNSQAPDEGEEEADEKVDAAAETEEQRIDGIFNEEIDAYLAANPGLTFSLEGRRRIKERTRARMRAEMGYAAAATTRPVAEVQQ